MMKITMKRFLSFTMALVIIFSIFAGTSVAGATGADEPPEEYNYISLDRESLTLAVGQGAALIASSDIEDAEISFDSSDDEVASVDDAGEVTALADGETVITASIETEDDQYQAQCTVTVTGIEGIEITQQPEKTLYLLSDDFDAQGLVVSLVYDNGDKAQISDYTLDGFNSDEIGEKIITVSYKFGEDEYTAQFSVEVVVGVSSITIESMPEKTVYLFGEDFDPTGFIVKAHYLDETASEITDYTLSGFDSNSAGIKEITVSYLYVGETYTATFEVEVITVDHIEIVSVPEKDTYYVSEDLDTTGLVVKAVYTNAKEEEITSYSVSGFDTSLAGEQEITVSYIYDGVEHTESFLVLVKAPYVNIEKESTTLELGQIEAIEVESNRPLREITSESSDEKVAIYKDGKIIACGAGTATITLTVTVLGVEYSDTITVEVTPNDSFVIEDGILLEYTGSEQYVTIPWEVTGIGYGAFWGNKNIKGVYFPNENITFIGSYAFRDCINLNDLYLPRGIVEIDEGAFQNTQSMTFFYLDSSVKSIGSRAFADNRNLNRVFIPSSVTSIGKDAFKNSPNVTIYCEKPSAAYDYAVANSIKYIVVDMGVSVQGVSLPEQAYVVMGRETQLNAVFTPANASNQFAYWTSSDPSIVSVGSSNGLVKGVSYGSAEITMVTLDGAYTATCVVNVNESEIDKIEIAQKPKTNYLVGEQLNLEGLVVNAVFTDATKVEIDDYTVGDYNLSSPGERVIVVSYDYSGKILTASFKITVVSPLTITQGTNFVYTSAYKKVGLFQKYKNTSIDLGYQIDEQVSSVTWKSDNKNITVDKNGTCIPTTWYSCYANVTLTVTTVGGNVYTQTVFVQFYRFNFQKISK